MKDEIDEIIEIKNKTSKEKYARRLRRVALWDDVNKQVIEIITNQMTWSANTIGELYKCRWQIEIFFREIKQLLNIKSFIGTSENAVMIQIWTALITILILKAKALAKFKWHLSNLVAGCNPNFYSGIQHILSDNSLIEVYPNPSTDIITVNLKGYNFTEQLNDVTLFDATGKELFHQTLKSLQSSIIIQRLFNPYYAMEKHTLLNANTNNGLERFFIFHVD